MLSFRKYKTQDFRRILCYKMYVSSDRRGDPVKKRTKPKKYTFIAAAAVAVGSVFFCFAADSADRKLPSAPAASVYIDTVYDDARIESVSHLLLQIDNQTVESLRIIRFILIIPGKI